MSKTMVPKHSKLVVSKAAKVVFFRIKERKGRMRNGFG